LAADSYIDQLSGVCERCIQEEIERRRSGEAGAAPNSRAPPQLPTSPKTPTPDSRRTSFSGGYG
jgi:hypothetical protein